MKQITAIAIAGIVSLSLFAGNSQAGEGRGDRQDIKSARNGGDQRDDDARQAHKQAKARKDEAQRNVSQARRDLKEANRAGDSAATRRAAQELLEHQHARKAASIQEHQSRREAKREARQERRENKRERMRRNKDGNDRKDGDDARKRPAGRSGGRRGSR